MEDWFRRKGYLKTGERLEVGEIGGPAAASCSALPHS
jgi:hypothetical protein